MASKLPILLLVSLWSVSVFAASDSTLVKFETANQAYQNGEYEEAIATYQSLAEQGESTALFFNLGNAYFKTNQVGKAILYYERALQLSPSDPDIQYNLKLANDRIKDKIEKLPELNITRWWKTFTLSFGVDSWAWGAIGFMVVAVLLLLLFFVSATRSLRIFGFYAGLLFVLFSGFSLYQASRAQQMISAQASAVIMAPRVDVKGAPTDSGVNVFVIHEGTKVRVLGERDGWVNIRIASGGEGWIKEGDCTVI